MGELNQGSTPIAVVVTGRFATPSGLAINGADGTTAASASNPTPVASPPTSVASVAVTGAQSTVAEGSRILKASAGNLYGLEICTGGSAGYLMLFDSTTVPADGTVTPKRVYAVAANASFARQFERPLRCASGIVLVFSTTGPFTKTISATAFLAGDFA